MYFVIIIFIIIYNSNYIVEMEAVYSQHNIDQIMIIQYVQTTEFVVVAQFDVDT